VLQPAAVTATTTAAAADNTIDRGNIRLSGSHDVQSCGAGQLAGVPSQSHNDIHCQLQSFGRGRNGASRGGVHLPLPAIAWRLGGGPRHGTVLVVAGGREETPGRVDCRGSLHALA
jgi:hypothetical protein